MEDAEAEVEKWHAETRIEKAIEREITKLRYHLEAEEERIENEDFTVMEMAVKVSKNNTDKIADLISQLEEIKLDQGISTRTVRQWKKDIKAKTGLKGRTD